MYDEEILTQMYVNVLNVVRSNLTRYQCRVWVCCSKENSNPTWYCITSW